MKFFTNEKWWKIPKAWYFFGIPAGALAFFVIGILFWGGFNASLELTNTEEFCVSCHEMEHTAYAEYKQSSHFNPTSGVSASCPDCHVPKPFIPKMIRKVKATTELWHKMLGTIDTSEKYESKRAELAENVWREMRSNDSRECRSCHNVERMNIEKQSRRAQKKHDPEYMKEKNKTCIDCHQGIAHELPEDDEDDDF